MVRSAPIQGSNMRMIYVLLAILGGFGAQYLMSAEEPAYWVLAFIIIFVSFLSLLMAATREERY